MRPDKSERAGGLELKARSGASGVLVSVGKQRLAAVAHQHIAAGLAPEKARA